MPLVHVYGDSLTKYLSSGLLERAFGLYNPVVYTRKGCTISLMNKFLLTQSSVPAPDVVLSHVGTNSLSNSAILTKFARQYKELLCTARNKFPDAHIIISELTPRTQFEVRTYNYELCCIADKVHNVSFGRLSIEEQDVNFDGIHLRRGGYTKLSEDVHTILSRRIIKRNMTSFPGTMVPPLVKEKTKKEKKKEEEKEKAANDAIKEPREQLKKVPSTRTIKNRMKRAAVPEFGSDFVKVGWTLPIPTLPSNIPVTSGNGTISYLKLNSVAQTRIPSSMSSPPAPPSPYITSRVKAKKRRRKSKRFKKRRSRRRRKQVGFYYSFSKFCAILHPMYV